MTSAPARSALLLAALSLAAPAWAQADAQGCKDHPAVTRMPKMVLGECDEKEFDAFAFHVGPMEKDQTQQVEGRYHRLGYWQQEGTTPVASALQIARNVQNAVKKAGGEVLADDRFDNGHRTTARLRRGDTETWLEVSARDGSYMLVVVERQAMRQDLAVDAAAMGTALDETGKVALYGIFFDTGKAVVKPESEPTLKEIARLLGRRPELTLFVVGHTDLVGDVRSNLKLSQDRAAAVVAALTGKHGVAAARLKPFGAGPHAPAATNTTEEGRAKNRRVELVRATLP